MNSIEYRQHHERVHDKALAAKGRCDELKHRWDAEWEIIEASRHGLRVLDTETYIRHKIALGNIEGALERARRKADFLYSCWWQMPMPKPFRKRKTVLVNGVRTKLEFSR